MPLKSVDEYNAERIAERKEQERRMKMTGVACPKCGQEMEWLYGMSCTYPAVTWPAPKASPAFCRLCNITTNLEL